MKNKSLNSGFTLIEIMISMAILSVMSLLIYSSTSQTIKGKDMSEKRDEVNHGASLVLNKISNDVETAFLLQQDFLPSDGKMKTAFKGTDNSVNFVSFSNFRYFKNVQEADYAEVGYFLKNDEENTSQQLLMRRQSATVDDDNEKGGREEVMLEGVKELDFEYYDANKKEWAKSWDSTQLENAGRLPRAVKITLKMFGADEEEELLYQTITELKMYKGVLNY